MRGLNRAGRIAVATACTYEAAAIATSRTPTITRLCGGRRWLGALIVGTLAWHLWWPAPERPPVVVIVTPPAG